MNFIRFSIILLIFAMLFSGCGSQISSEKNSEVNSEVKQAQENATKNTTEQPANNSSSSKPSHDAKYQPLPKNFDHEKYNISGLSDIEVKKVKRQIENGIYIPKKRVDFQSVNGLIEGSIWTIQRVIASDYCIELRTIRSNGIDQGRKFTWYLYEDGSVFGTPQSLIFLYGYDVNEFIPNQLHPSSGGENAFIALVAARKVFNQYGAKYDYDKMFDRVIKEY